MESLNLILDLESKGFRDGEYPVSEYEGSLNIGGMAEGTEGKKPIVMIAFEDPTTGGYLVAQTTLALFLTAADGLKAKYGDPRLP